MRIHGNTITPEEIRAAALSAGCGVEVLREHGSRSRARAYEVQLSGRSITGGQYGATPYRTATWDEWGMVLADMFRADASLRVPGTYETAEHFHWATCERYRDLTPAGVHLRHRWTNVGVSAGGAYRVARCEDRGRSRGCGAMLRIITPGRYSDVFGSVAA